ncbi:binding protein [Corchorus olitorius]|uniref:Binding protein n=1 Tax=Corchorus olitorius TaxID=93759 RepID=A0A1R3I714_9ROSI|nr:binding protein [Corchorus olitorius]
MVGPHELVLCENEVPLPWETLKIERVNPLVAILEASYSQGWMNWYFPPLLGPKVWHMILRQKSLFSKEIEPREDECGNMVLDFCGRIVIGFYGRMVVSFCGDANLPLAAEDDTMAKATEKDAPAVGTHAETPAVGIHSMKLPQLGLTLKFR